MVKSLYVITLSFALFPCAIACFSLTAQGQQMDPGGKPKASAVKSHPVAAEKPAAEAYDGPPVAPSPHKIWVDAVNNKLFWPMDMPFWVRLTPSPDPNAPSYLMERVAPNSDITTDKYNKEGIALEIRGPQFIRWFNYITKQTVNLQFYTDGDPPETRAACSGAPTAVVADVTFYGKGLHCALTATDAVSGVETTFLSMDGQPYKPYAGEAVLDKEESAVLRYYSVDHTGYQEKPQALRFTVDLTPPTTTHAITGNALGDVLSAQARFQIASSDVLSGVATVNARLDQQEFKPVTNGEVAVDELPDGPHTLSYYAVDRVGNQEPEHVVPFYLDRLPPTVEAEIIGDLWVAPNGTRYVSSRSQVQLSAEDNKSGVDKIVSSADGAPFEQYGAPFLLPAHAGAGKLEYRAADKLGNTSAVSTLAYTMDTTAPESAYRITGPSFQVRSDIYITRDSRVVLSATDDASGVARIEYQAEGAAQPETYTEPLAFPDEDRRLVRYWSTDRVNNRELDRALVLITDNTPPVIFANFSLKPSNTASPDALPVFRRQTSLFLGATDNASGVHKIYYSFDGGKEMEYSTPLVLDREGTFDLLIRADDNLGNQSSKHLRFTIHD